MLKKYFAALVGFLMIGFLALSGAAGAQASGGEHPHIVDVDRTNATSCVAEDGTISIETKGKGKRGYIYTYDAIPVGGGAGPVEGYSDLNDPQTGVAPGKYKIFLLERKKSGDYKDWDKVKGSTKFVKVGRDCTPVAPSAILVHPDCDDLGTWTGNETTGVEYSEAVEIEHGDTGEITASLAGDKFKWAEGFGDGSRDDVTLESATAVRNPCDGNDGNDGNDGADGNDGNDGDDGDDGVNTTNVVETIEVVETVEVVEVPTRINTGR